MQKHLEAVLAADALPGATHAWSEDIYAMLVEAAVEQRDLAALHTYCPLAEESAGRIGHKLFMGIAFRGWAVAHTLAREFTQAQARLQQALDLFTSYPLPWQVGRTLLEMGQLARARGNPSEARDRLSRALQAFERLRAEPYARSARAALDALNHA